MFAVVKPWGCILPDLQAYALRVLSPSGFQILRMRFPVTILGVLPVTVASAVQSIQHEGICSYSAHLFIDVLAKIGNVKNATSVIQVRINQIFPKAFEQR